MKQKPYKLLLWTALVFALSSLFTLKQSNAVDIHLHDTYFVITHTHLFWLLAILAFVIWTVYALTSKILYSKSLTWTHVIITVLTLLILALTILFGHSNTTRKPLLYLDYSSWNSFDIYPASVKAIGITIFVMLIAQLIFVINATAGLLKTLANRNT